MLQSFIEKNCVATPGGTCGLKAFVRLFRAANPQAAKWSRSRIVGALAEAGFPTAVDSQGVARVVGLVSHHSSDRNRWQADLMRREAGRLFYDKGGVHYE